MSEKRKAWLGSPHAHMPHGGPSHRLFGVHAVSAATAALRGASVAAVCSLRRDAPMESISRYWRPKARSVNIGMSGCPNPGRAIFECFANCPPTEKVHLDETTNSRDSFMNATMQVLFKQFFATAVMGLGHGLILLPVLLSIVGPASYRCAFCCFLPDSSLPFCR